MQQLPKLQQAKQLLTQVEAMQKKEVVLKARLGLWLHGAYLVSTNIHEILVSLGITHQKIKRAGEGQATKKMVEQVNQEVI